MMCENPDPTFLIFERCELKAISRNTKDIHIKAILFQVPVNDFAVSITNL